MLEITSKEQFDQEIKEGVVLIDVYAPWCGPCKMISPALKELSEKYTNVKFIKVNADELKEIADELEVMSVPTVITLINGSVIKKEVGFRPKEVIEEQIVSTLEKILL